MILPPIPMDPPGNVVQLRAPHADTAPSTEPAPNVLELNASHKDPGPVPPDGQYLRLAPFACSHHNGPFLVDERLAEVTCSRCKEKLNPMWVLTQLTHTESRWHQFFARYQDELARLKERSRTKCRRCGEMTPISRG